MVCTSASSEVASMAGGRNARSVVALGWGVLSPRRRCIGVPKKNCEVPLLCTKKRELLNSFQAPVKTKKNGLSRVRGVPVLILACRYFF